jgi:hypothetical protein
MRTQVGRQRGEIRELQRAGIPSASAEALLERMLNKIDALCVERDKLKRNLPPPSKGKVLGGCRMVSEPPKYFQDEANPPPWMKALAEVRITI